jgi:hypothetical protein
MSQTQESKDIVDTAAVLVVASSSRSFPRCLLGGLGVPGGSLLKRRDGHTKLRAVAQYP